MSPWRLSVKRVKNVLVLWSVKIVVMSTKNSTKRTIGNQDHSTVKPRFVFHDFHRFQPSNFYPNCCSGRRMKIYATVNNGDSGISDRTPSSAETNNKCRIRKKIGAKRRHHDYEGIYSRFMKEEWEARKRIWPHRRRSKQEPWVHWRTNVLTWENSRVVVDPPSSILISYLEWNPIRVP